jgi:hypothetical protein
MRILSMILVLALVILASGCRGSAENDADSILFLFNDVTGAAIADGDNRGAITMNIGDTRELRVMRRVTDADEGTITTNVTAEADFNTTDPLVANVSDNGDPNPGVITAISVGTTIIEVIFRDEDGDETDDDSAFIDVTVQP